jgi:hypothetical protein
MITIHPSEIAADGSRTRLNTVLEYGGRKRTLWYSVENAYAQYLLPGRVDHCLVPLLPLAMLYGEDIRVVGGLSERLFYNMTRHLTRILSLMHPRLRPVKIHPEALDATLLRTGRGAVVTGFTAGIDSSCVIAENFFGDVPEGFRITHCLFNNVGSHGREVAGATPIFEKRIAYVRPILEEWHLPQVTVDTNLHEFFTGPDEIRELEYIKTHSLRNVSGALLLQKFFGRYLYASAFSYKDCRLSSSDIAYSDPYVIHLLSTESMECVSSGCQHTRTEKTAIVSRLEASHRYLCVCTAKHAPNNCSVCKKCARTLLTLEILGQLDHYADTFNLEKYRKVRSRFIANVLSSSDPFSVEIVRLAKEKGFRFAPSLHLAARLGLKNLLPGKRALK